MPEQFSIITAEPVSDREVRDFIRDIGGFDTEMSDQVGRISDQGNHVWVHYAEDPYAEYEGDAVKLIKAALSPNQAFAEIAVDMGYGETTEVLAAEFACKFMMRWKSIVFDPINDQIFTPEQVCALSRQGLRIPQY